MTRGRAGILSGTPSLSSALVEEFLGRRIGEAVVDSRLERQARNESLIREMNERIEQLDRVAKAGLEGEHLVFEFLCECGAGERGDAGCEEQIEMTVAEYEEVRQQDDRFALLPGHETEELETVLRRTKRYV